MTPSTSPIEAYVVYCLDAPGTAALRDQNLASHRAYLASQPLRILLAGAVLSEDRSRTIGSFIFLETDSAEAASAFNRNDPFFKLGLWKSVEIQPFTVARHAYHSNREQD